MFKQFYFVLVLGTVLACHASPKPVQKVPGSNNLQPTEQESVICKTVAAMMYQGNYKRVPQNDSLSAVVFNTFLKDLDENHNYLLASDVADFARFKYTLDDDVKDGNLANVFYIFNVFQKRYEERINYSLAQVDQNFDFTKDESFVYNREKMPYAATVADLNEDWHKRVKYDMLNLMLADNNLDKNRKTLKTRYQELLKQVNQLESDDVFQMFMRAFTESVDPHTDYFIPHEAAQFQLEMTRQLQGIGATLNVKNEYVYIVSLVPGGPADKSHQVNVNDRIVAVAQGADGEFQDIVGWRVDNAIKLIRGPKGSIVRLKLLPDGKSTSDKPNVVQLVREKIVLQDQLVSRQNRTYNSGGKQVKIGIINVPSFYNDPSGHSTTKDVKMILDSMKNEGVGGVVLDLRENGGGLLTEAVSLSGLFIKTGPVVQVRQPGNRIEAEDDEDPSVSWSGPMAVLVDRLSASASEIFTGAMQDYGRAVILGNQTYGKGTVQAQIDLDNVIKGSAGTAQGNESKFGQLNLTIEKFYRITGNSTQRHGVMPDIKFPSVIPLDKYGEDTQPAALPFDIIPKANYVKVGDLSAIIPQLNKMHEQRMAADQAYKYLLQDIADAKKSDAEKTVTLNEEKLKKEREANEQKAFERDNARRVALGLQPLKKGEPKPKKEDLDFLKFEAGQIVTDYVNITGKVARANSTMMN